MLPRVRRHAVSDWFRRRRQFYDVRAASSASVPATNSAAMLGQYVDSHHEDVLRVRFHPTRATSLLTAGADGLACLFDVSQQNEDDALQVVMNAGSDIVNVSVIDGADLVYCQTSVEGAALFDARTGASCGAMPNSRTSSRGRRIFRGLHHRRKVGAIC